MVATETRKRDSEESVILCPISSMVDPNVAAIVSKDTVRLITKSTKPGIIMIEKSSDNKLRSGKWTAEEETYAKILIDLFEEGCIDDDRITKKGMTLRAYLSRKLHCSPMRISKKFAGRGIGKLVYMSKNPMKYQRHAQSIQDESLLYKLNLLEQAESNFLRIAFPDRDPTIRKASEDIFLSSNEMPTRFDTSHISAHQQQLDIGYEHLWTATSDSAPAQTPLVEKSCSASILSSTFASTAPNDIIGSFDITPSPNFHESFLIQGQTSTSIATPRLLSFPESEIHEMFSATFDTASQEQQRERPETKRKRRQNQDESQLEILEKAYTTVISPKKLQTLKSVSDSNDTSPNAPAMQMPLVEVRPERTKRTKQNCNVDVTMIESQSKPAKNIIGNELLSTIVEATPNDFDGGQVMNEKSDINLPNFLSGYDKLSKQSPSSEIDQNSIAYDIQHLPEYSPAYHTSKSFDDFHRFLGKGLSPTVPLAPKFSNLHTTAAGPAIPSINSLKTASPSTLQKRPRIPLP